MTAAADRLRTLAGEARRSPVLNYQTFDYAWQQLEVMSPELALLCADMADTLAYVDDWRDRVGIDSPAALLARLAALSDTQEPA